MASPSPRPRRAPTSGAPRPGGSSRGGPGGASRGGAGGSRSGGGARREETPRFETPEERRNRRARQAPKVAGRPLRMSGGKTHEGPRPEPGERWIDEGRVGAAGSPKQHYSKKKKRVEVPELGGLVGAKRASTLEARVAEAADAFADDRFGDAGKILQPIASEAPSSPAVRELYGLTLYRLGKWKAAANELEAFVGLAHGSTEQHPVLADCHRALRHWSRVNELWGELRESSPSADLVNEGRIVSAGALADQDRLADAISLLERGWKPPKVPKEHHLRRAYALAALYERAGDLPRARITFGWVVSIEPGFADASDRLSALA